MDRITMIHTVGLDFLTSDIENGEFSYAQVLGRPLTGHYKLDIRFYDKVCKMTRCDDGIPFVTRTATNNGVGGIVEPIEGVKAYPAGSLSIALGGSIGSTFLQTRDFYTSQNVAVLQPKEKLSSSLLLFLATLIEKECSLRFVAFGRELNKHIKRDFTIKLPLLDEDHPDWKKLENLIKDRIIPQLPKKAQKVWLQKYDTKPLHQMDLKLNINEWHWFRVGDLFPPLKCKCSNATELLEDGDEIAYIGAKKTENGVMRYVKREEKLVSRGNCIVFIGDGQGSVGYSLYQPVDFIGSTTLLAGYNEHLNPYNAAFIVSVLDQERFRYSFGRKYNKEVVSNTIIKLPAIKQDIEEYEPDWQFMEDYIKSLPYSKNLEPSDTNEQVDELMEVKRRVIEMERKMETLSGAATINIYENGSNYYDNSRHITVK